MSGIYIHIPFCQKSCYYCDFHFSVNKKNIGEMVNALKNEIVFYGKYNNHFFDDDEKINTIYFGGGTPSILKIDELSEILEKVFRNYNIANSAEITIEANPDNLTYEYCQSIKKTGVNRLSIGIQSFFDAHLKWMNRSHNSKQAFDCINNAQKSGFDNINADLIYGFDGLTDEQWSQNLDIINKTGIKHLSCYSLTVEEKTPLKRLIETGRYSLSDENNAIIHFNFLQDWATKHNWEHYEISNLCKDGFYSTHNCSYWKNEKYLGIGPSAHSFNQTVRRWNLPDNKIYIKKWLLNIPSYNSETLTAKEKYNDYVLTSLRTKWGIDLEKIKEISGYDFLFKNVDTITKYKDLDFLVVEKNFVKLTEKGMLLADKIASDLFEL